VSAATAGAGRHRRGAAFWVSGAVGWAIIGWALWQIGRHRVDTRPEQLARFVLGGIVVHDLVVVPLALAAAAAVRRVVPRRARRWVQAALVATAVLAAFAYPLVRGFARVLRNPTSLPRNYTASLAFVLAAAWALLVLAALGRASWARLALRRARR
jgi:Kef-type K+ transport system membrane component KefB